MLCEIIKRYSGICIKTLRVYSLLISNIFLHFFFAINILILYLACTYIENKNLILVEVFSNNNCKSIVTIIIYI